MKHEDLSDRFLIFGASVVRFVVKLEKTPIGKHISNQLFRSATSSGANYEEACGAESKADFIHKMQIVLKELRESIYWLKLIKKSDVISTEELTFLLSESDELVRIIAKSVITAKGKK
ncbi:MAG: four helix bundle protein [Bacteroidota bacterium]|nr:four helix bundle protein [Bacteroidota bacterium]